MSTSLPLHRLRCPPMRAPRRPHPPPCRPASGKPAPPLEPARSSKDLIPFFFYSFSSFLWAIKSPSRAISRHSPPPATICPAARRCTWSGHPAISFPKSNTPLASPPPSEASQPSYPLHPSPEHRPAPPPRRWITAPPCPSSAHPQASPSHLQLRPDSLSPPSPSTLTADHPRHRNRTGAELPTANNGART